LSIGALGLPALAARKPIVARFLDYRFDKGFRERNPPSARGARRPARIQVLERAPALQISYDSNQDPASEMDTNRPGILAVDMWGMKTVAKILIVDDSAFTRNLIGRILQRGGHEVVGAAEGGTEAVDLFKHLQPELVTLDYLMPDKSGEAVLDEIIGLDPGAKVIMISGSADQSITDRVLQKGAKSFLEKPDVQRDILQVVDQVMGA
jgi:two-component system chemotaxis response regulator CheY